MHLLLGGCGCCSRMRPKGKKKKMTATMYPKKIGNSGIILCTVCMSYSDGTISNFDKLLL